MATTQFSGWMSARARRWRRISGRPSRQRIDGVDVDEAVVLPEGAGRDVGLVFSGRIEALGLDEGNVVRSKSAEDVFEERRANPLVPLVVSHGEPKDLGGSRRPGTRPRRSRPRRRPW